MGNKSELELFLQSHAAEGQVDSRDASFTLAAHEALRKIASFQLPFEGAWAVKIIQSIVAGGSSSYIRVDLMATNIRFYFLDPGFTLKELETAFHDPNPSPNRSLRHLLSGLWNVGLKERWGFQVAFPRESRTLIWDGERLNEFESQKTRDCVCIDIAPLQQKSSLSWVARVAMSGNRNATLLMAMARRCYVCPLPLTVDGRRIDSLQRSEHQGWSKTSYPLTVGFAEADLPGLPIPRGTFESLPKSLDPTIFVWGGNEGGGWKRIAEKRMEGLMRCDQAAVAYVLSVHMELVRSGKSESWEEAEGPSVVYWVLDGALVSTESLLGRNYHCSIGCFLSAEGLETDLSTFGLMESPERRQRVQLARETLRESLESVKDASFEEMIQHGKLRQRAFGGLIMAAGVGLFWISPLHGIGAAAAGAALFGTAGSTEQQRVETTQTAVRELSNRLGNEPATYRSDFL